MKALLIRPGHALGDAIFTTPIPRLLAQRGYEVDVACEESVQSIFQHNPYVSKFITVPPFQKKDEVQKFANKLPALMKEYDKTFHAHGYVEVGLMYRTDTCWGCIPNGLQRKEKGVGKNYMDEILENLELEERGVIPEFYFSPEEEQEMQEMRTALDVEGSKLVIWQWDGSTQSKVLVHSPAYLAHIMERFPKAIHYVFAEDANLKAQIPKDSRVINGFEKKTPVRDSIMMCKIADMVIGPESFLVNAAGAFDTPEMIFFSHSAPENLSKYYRNCHNVVPNSLVDCHPCYLIQINFQHVYDPLRRGINREFERNCRVWNPEYVYESLGYKCCYFLPHEEILQAIAGFLDN